MLPQAKCLNISSRIKESYKFVLYAFIFKGKRFSLFM